MVKIKEKSLMLGIGELLFFRKMGSQLRSEIMFSGGVKKKD